MTESPDTAGTPAHRIGRRRIVAIAVAAVMLLGIAGLVAVSLVGGDSTPTGAGLQAPVDVAAPATAAAGSAPDDAASPAAAAPPAPPGDDAGPSGDDFDVDATATPIDSTPDSSPDDSTPEPGGAVGSIAQLPSDADLPEPSEPVELPALIAPPAPASSVATMTMAEFDPAIVAGLDGWDVTARRSDYLELTDGSTIVEVFVLDGSTASADEALDRFFAGIDADVAELDESPATRLPAPDARYVSVSGAQFTAVDARQYGTRSITGSVLAAIDENGRAIVVSASRPGTSSLAEHTRDSERIAAVLAHVAP